MVLRDILLVLLGALLVLVPAAGYYAVRKLDLFELKPDEHLVYRQMSGVELRLHRFRAARAQGGEATPALLLFHGGAWKYGHPRQFYRQCEYFAARGIECFSAEYRIESRHGTDARAAVDDARAAFRYLVEHHRRLAIDPGRIAVGGGSAGGHLAAMLGVGPVADGAKAGAAQGAPTRPAALVLYNPTLDLSPCLPDHHLVADFWREISPRHHVDEAVPPTLVLLGTEDKEVPVPVARGFCEAVEGAGGTCRLQLYEGAKHGFFNPGVEGGRFFEDTNERVVNFLQPL